MTKQRMRLAAGLLVLAACARKADQQSASAATSFSSDRLSVVIRGSGPDIILIPGLTSSRAVWDSVAGPLEGRYRLHLVQVNGFAGTPPGPNSEGPVSAPVAEEIARYITSTGLAKPAVIGHSMGGTIGMMLAARHPELVGRLMVVDMIPSLGIAFVPPGAPPESLRAIADRMQQGMVTAPADSFVAGFGQMIAGMTRKQGVKPDLLESVRGSDQATVAHAFHELIVTDLRPELSRITVPLTVLYVIPPNPPLPPVQYEAGLQADYATVPQARLIKIEDSYHFIQIDQPERFVSEVDAFMRGA